MKGIRVKQHRLLVEGLQNLKEIAKHETLIDGEKAIEESLDMLLQTFKRYEQLIEELTVMTGQYEKVHRDVRTKILSPALRELKKINSQDSPCYFLIREVLINTKNF
ncbi:hypothetical protein [Sphingobacterium paludis]|jgi:DNA-binding ferritin-like protein|uniref:Uncharacterized protein n=1 Tax=Sphingobacterium paludis TaxID=1476465 RepID=A0A4R7CYY1_9SPHI|nr:hypothetical protein [Sphingobacterium paludis]TDS12961.1 hypothetical protein B0I21_10592 [Sphingobacterium paludis]